MSRWWRLIWRDLKTFFLLKGEGKEVQAVVLEGGQFAGEFAFVFGVVAVEHYGVEDTPLFFQLVDGLHKLT